MTSNSQTGFILPAALWLVAIMTLGASLFGEWATSQLQLAAKSRQRFLAQQEMSAIEDYINFYAHTQTLSPAGLVFDNKNPFGKRIRTRATDKPFVLKADGTPYTYNTTTVRIWDIASFIPLSNIYLKEILMGYDKLNEFTRDELYGHFVDFIQGDGMLKSNNGASDADYKDADKLKPLHTPLRTPYELKAILKWESTPDLWQKDHCITDFVSPHNHKNGLNINTISLDVLRHLPHHFRDIDKLIDTLKNKRESTEPYFKKETEITAFLKRFKRKNDTKISEKNQFLKFFTLPTGIYRVTLESNTTPLGRTYVINLSGGQSQPTYGYRLPFSEKAIKRLNALPTDDSQSEANDDQRPSPLDLFTKSKFTHSTPKIPDDEKDLQTHSFPNPKAFLTQPAKGT